MPGGAQLHRFDPDTYVTHRTRCEIAVELLDAEKRFAQDGVGLPACGLVPFAVRGSVYLDAFGQECRFPEDLQERCVDVVDRLDGVQVDIKIPLGLVVAEPLASVDLRAANAVGEQLCALSLRVTVFRDRDAGPDRFAESEVAIC